ncbi:hypothetical protein RJ55_02710 [Drechmeria coniospora]|nr:hypothetical protein RJ55_02710 [Drechmeria coniospora]
MESSSPREIIAQHVHRRQPHDVSGLPSAQRWCLAPEVPLAAELMANDPPALPRVDQERAMPKMEYLEAQYRLHRYEATEPLRKAIQQFRRDQLTTKQDNAFTYTQVCRTTDPGCQRNADPVKVKIHGYIIRNSRAACRVSFSTDNDDSEMLGTAPERLLPGTLVALTPRADGFRTKCLVATVAACSDSGSAVELTWALDTDAVMDPTTIFVMLEPKHGYFEANRHIMLGLQHAAFSASRLDKYIYEPFSGHKDALILRETPCNRASIPPSAESLDPSQRDAFNLATSKELTIVQGPPGTGKTFTSLVAIESFVETLKHCEHGKYEGTPAPPVIIAAQTNHALDKLLDRCMKCGIGSIVRLGGGSTSSTIIERSLFNLRRKCGSRDGSAEWGTQKRLRRSLRDVITEGFPAGLLEAKDMLQMGFISHDQYRSLVEGDWETAEPMEGPVAIWLDHYHQQRQRESPDASAASAFTSGGEKDFTPIEISRPVAALLTFQHANDVNDIWLHRAKRLLAMNSDLYQIKPVYRGNIYCYLYKKMLDAATIQVQRIVRELDVSCRNLTAARWETSVRAIRDDGVRILGCTTTGLAKYRGLIAALQPRIMLVEEAAEAREGNIAAALYPTLDQLVLVGDHQQLVPQVQVHELCVEPHRLNVSLFERLVNIKIPYCALRVQRRMVPTLRRVVQTFYPNLEDHESVTRPALRPPVPGMGDCRLWWFQNRWTQSRGADGYSYANPREAEMIVSFVRYLVQNGVRPQQVTVLAYYSAQVELIKRRMTRNAYLMVRAKAVRDETSADFEWAVRTIDGFQGEENDVILLSLVRGPDTLGGRAKPGFVADENRAVVATSRARCGFYIFGNVENVLQGSRRSRETWGKVFRAFEGHTGESLPVTCQAHGKVTKISQPRDWDGVSTGGCHARCRVKCANGHPCLLTCHPRQTDDDVGKRDYPKNAAPYGQACQCAQGCGVWDDQAQSIGLDGSFSAPQQPDGCGSKDNAMVTSDMILEQGAHNYFESLARGNQSDESDSESFEELLISLTRNKK